MRIAKPALIRDGWVYEAAQSARLVLTSNAVAGSCAQALLAGLARLFMAARRNQPARGVGIDQFQRGQPAEGHGGGGFDHDDCSINGAWRHYLHPLLETNAATVHFPRAV